MAFWYDTCADCPNRPIDETSDVDKLHDDVNTEKKAESMPKFNRDRALKIMESGTDEQKRALVDELANMLEHKSYGVVWEHGGTSEDSPFEAENVVLEYDKGIPYPVLREDLSLSVKRERERERESHLMATATSC